MKPKHMYETRSEVAKRLPIGTWFVWPGTVPRAHKYYRPRLYRVLDNHKPSSAMHEDFGLWEIIGASGAHAAYERIDMLARTLNAMCADEQVAKKYIQKQHDDRIREAMSNTAALLRRDYDDG